MSAPPLDAEGWSGVIGLELSWLQGEALIEHPAHLFEGFGCLRQLQVGAYTYARSHITPEVSRIGRYCSIAEGVKFGHREHPTNWLSTSSFTYDAGFMGPANGVPIPNSRFSPKPLQGQERAISIGNDVWVGSFAYIRAGVTLGDGCIVGSHAVVTRDVPPYAVVAGNPGRVVKHRLPPGLATRVQATRWWDYAFTEFDGLDPSNLDQALARLEHLMSSGLQRHTPPVSLFRADRPTPALECEYELRRNHHAEPDITTKPCSASTST